MEKIKLLLDRDMSDEDAAEVGHEAWEQKGIQGTPKNATYDPATGYYTVEYEK